MNIDVIPDITMRGQADPYARGRTEGPPTVGAMAGRLAELAARADFARGAQRSAQAPVRVRLDDPNGDTTDLDVWLITWPPGHRTDLHGHGGGTAITMLIEGELSELAVSTSGVTERPLRRGRVKVHGRGHVHELANTGTSHAVTLHARPAA